MKWKNVKTEDPKYDNVNYLVVLKVINDYVYGFAYWDGEKWIYESEKDAVIVAFTETNPKLIIDNL